MRSCRCTRPSPEFTRAEQLVEDFLVAPSPRPLLPGPLLIRATAILVTSVAVTVLEPSGITPLFVATSVLISALITAAFGIAAAKLFMPALLRIAAALIVDRSVSLLLPGIRPLAWNDLLLQQPPDIP